MPDHSPPRLLILILLMGLSVLSLNMFLPSLGAIAAEFGVDYATASLSIGAYLAVTAVLMLILGPLSDKVGRRPVLLGSLLSFLGASIGCYFAQNFVLFLTFRILQGGMVSGMMLSRAIVRDISSGQDATRLLGTIGTAMALAPLLGPMLGGGLDQLFGWRSNFAAFALMGAILLILCWIDLEETNTSAPARFSDQFKAYSALLRDYRFWAWTMCLVGSVGSFYVFISGAPAVAESHGFSPATTGFSVGIISGGFMIGNYLIARNLCRFDEVTMIVIGRFTGLFGCVGALALLAIDISHPAVLFAGAIFVGLGNGLTLPGANAGVMSVNPALAGSAAGLSGALTVAVAAILTPFTAANASGDGGMIRLLIIMAVTIIVSLVAVIPLLRTSPD